LPGFAVLPKITNSYAIKLTNFLAVMLSGAKHLALAKASDGVWGPGEQQDRCKPTGGRQGLVLRNLDHRFAGKMHPARAQPTLLISKVTVPPSVKSIESGQ